METKYELINKLYKRFGTLCKTNSINHPYLDDKLTFNMDMDSVANVCDFNKLLNQFSDFDFVHDICGIYNNLDRNCHPAKLINCFYPRCGV